MANFWRNASVLVTGAHGFTGSHLCRELVEQGAKVKAFVKNGGMISNLSDIREKVTIYSGDVTDITSLFTAMEGVDYVFNVAAIVPIVEARQSPQACLQVNTIGAYNVAYAAMKSGVKRMLHISTCHIYGFSIPEQIPIKETLVPRPRDVYAASKYAAEICLKTLVDEGFSVVFTRAFAMYGPAQREQLFIPRVISHLLRNQVPKLGNSHPTRDYCFIKDTVRGYLLALEKGKPGEVYHLSSGKEIVMKDLYDLIANLMGSKLQAIWNTEPRPHEIDRLCGNSDKAQEAFGWKPEVSFKEGLKITVEWWKNHPELWKPGSDYPVGPLAR